MPLKGKRQKALGSLLSFFHTFQYKGHFKPLLFRSIFIPVITLDTLLNRNDALSKNKGKYP
jgi:hypothetical protein